MKLINFRFQSKKYNVIVINRFFLIDDDKDLFFKIIYLSFNFNLYEIISFCGKYKNWFNFY